MMVRFLQVTCDGCATAVDEEDPDATYISLRKKVREQGWRNYGLYDYCPACIAAGKYKMRYTETGRAIGRYSVYKSDADYRDFIINRPI